MRYMSSSASRFLLLWLGLALAGCPDGGSEKPSSDAAIVPDATPLPPDGAVAPDAAVAPSGHPGGALVPAGAASRSSSYRFVGTLSPGGPAASTQHTVRSGVAGATQ
jgi:hypothetical protein